MNKSDFKIGTEFTTETGPWRCVDIGERHFIVAIKLDHLDDPSWYNGPPYAVAASAFDAYDMIGCEPCDPITG